MTPKPHRGIHVVSLFLIRPDGRFCLSRRRGKGVSYIDYWQNPGGKVEHGEKFLEEAMSREVGEEVGISIDPTTIHYLGTIPTISPNSIPYFVHVFMHRSLKDHLKVYNAEPHKSTDWSWFTIEDALSKATPMMPVLYSALHLLKVHTCPESADIKSL